MEWSNSLLRHFKIQTLLKINCSMAAISPFGVTQHSQIFHFSLETEFNALRFINYTIPRLCSTYAVATIGGIFRAERYFLLLKATSHSTIVDIPMRLLREDERHRGGFTPLKKACNSRDGNYSFEFCTLHAAHT